MIVITTQVCLKRTRKNLSMQTSLSAVSRNNIVLNKSWFTVHIQVIYGPHIVYNHHPLNLIGWER